MDSSSHAVRGYLHSYLSRRRGEPNGDRELLRRFAEGRDGDAFALLLQRHGPMVLGLARRVVGDWQLAEDVFQAAFLLLARKAHTIRRPDALPCWLHGVAFRLALRARRSRQRRRERETHARRSPPPAPLDGLTAQEFLAVLDEELQKLPEGVRAPLILCCLEGLSQEEAAKRLGCSSGAVKGRLERGRSQLRRRLEKRGLLPPAVLGGALLIADSASALPPALAQSTLHAAREGSAPPAAAALIQESMRSMSLLRLKAIGATLMLLAVAGTGLGTLALREAEKSAPPSAARGEGPSGPAEGIDLYGDPLPDGAVMRLGTIRRRAVGAQLAVTADGQSVVSVRGGKYVSIWGAENGKLRERHELPGEALGISRLSPGGRLLARQEVGGKLVVREVRSGKALHTLTVRGAHQFAPVAFSPDAKRLAAVCHVGNERSVRVWDVDTGKEVWEKQVRTNFESEQLAFAPDGNRLLVSFASNDEGMSCWDLAGDRRVWQNKAFRPNISILVTPDGKVLSNSPRTPVLDLATGWPARLKNFPRITYDMIPALSPDGRTLLLSTARSLIVWDLTHGKEVRVLLGAGNEVVFLPDGKSVVTNNGSLQRWDLNTGKPLWADTFALGHVDEVVDVAFSADGSRLVSASADGSVRLWDTRTGAPLRVWQGHEATRPVLDFRQADAGVKALDITPDGRWVLSAGSGEDVKLWGAAREKEVRSLRPPEREPGEGERYFFRLRISPDGARAVGLFVARSALGRMPVPKVATWDLETGALLTWYPVEKAEARSSAFSPDGRTLLTGGALVDVASGKPRVRLEKTKGSARPAFSPDGALVISSFVEAVEKDGIMHLSASGVRLWEAATGKVIAELKTNAGSAQVTPHPDNRLVATNDLFGVRLWDVLTGKVVASRKMPEQLRSWRRSGYTNCLTFTPDGRRMATGHPDSTILLWDVRLPAPRPGPPAARELESLWADLAGADAAKAWRAVWRMAEAPNDALPFLRGRVRPHPTAAAGVTRELLADLDGDSFERREAAVKRLKELGLQAEPALRAALRAKPSLEQKKRIESVLAALKEAPQPPALEELRQLRAIVVLERIGSPEARRALEELAKGPESARRTRQALTALACLRKSSR